MKRFVLFATLIVVGAAVAFSLAPIASEFQPPVRLMSGGVALRVESPGFAAPCWTDLNGDGKPCLLVGQFLSGKIRVFKHLGGEKFAAGEWLRADGKTAEVPGVW